MCVLFIAWKAHPDYPLIIAANRDEYFERNTASLAPWTDQPIIAGRDLAAGGTWLGLTTKGHIAGLTNIRRPDLTQLHKRSRGELVVNYLLATEDFPSWLIDHAQDYNPFNLLFGSAQQLWTFDSVRSKIAPMPPGFHSISNGALDDIWPKMARGTQALQAYIQAHAQLEPEPLLALLQDSTPAPYERLPQTGIPLKYEHRLSSIFIPAANFPQGQYGTRSSSVLLYSPTHYQFIEQSYNEHGNVIHYEHLRGLISSII
ncbi:NRDE family protein [Thiofilum flexile]|uniref:NRDE family protein n=1 Tax=Thiofilum flexile TaxID=125627 RepID=UPI000379E4E7|nr:NRDE family protein [Thiofilum flexile]